MPAYPCKRIETIPEEGVDNQMVPKSLSALHVLPIWYTNSNNSFKGNSCQSLVWINKFIINNTIN